MQGGKSEMADSTLISGDQKKRYRRSYIDIMAEILTECREKTQKTHILTQVNLNHALLQRYIQFMVEKGLLELGGGGHIWYKTTAKGEKFLESFKDVAVCLK